MKRDIIIIGKSKIPIKKGALRKQLRVPESEKIDDSLLRRIIKGKAGGELHNPYTKSKVKITPLLKRRANLAKTLRKLRK
jgi:hypothetical protein